jgi:hypothetical protein
MRILSPLTLVVFTMFIATNSAFSIDDTTHAGQAVHYAGQASVNASASAAHSIAASGQVTSAASAMPLAIGGAVSSSVGTVSTSAAHNLMKAATAPADKHLDITDETITTTPPDEALKKKEEK